MRSSSLSLSSCGSQMTPPLPPPNGMLTTAHFQVIQAASARTSSSETSGAKRMPPLAGPLAMECWTRYPVNTSTRPSSRTTGIFTVSSMVGSRNTLRIPSSSFNNSAASSKRWAADSQGFTSSSTDGVASNNMAEVLLKMSGLSGGGGSSCFMGSGAAPALDINHYTVTSDARLQARVLKFCEQGRPGASIVNGGVANCVLIMLIVLIAHNGRPRPKRPGRPSAKAKTPCALGLSDRGQL